MPAFSLNLRHAVEPAQPRHAVEDPGELGVLGDLALVEHDVALGIDAARDEGGRDLANAALELGRILPDGDRVHVDHAIDAVVLLLQRDELDHCAEIVAEMQIAGRLHPGKDPFLAGHSIGLRCSSGVHATAARAGARGGRGARARKSAVRGPRGAARLFSLPARRRPL